MAYPRKNPAGSPVISVRMPLELLQALRDHGEVTAQIVQAVRVYLDVINDMPPPPP